MSNEAIILEPIIPIPSQQRSKEALERFLRAGERALSEDIFEDTGIADIAFMAESSVGTFYRIIGDKEVLIMAVFQRFMERAMNTIADVLNPEKWQGKDLESIIAALVKTTVEIYQDQEGLLRALIRRASADHDFREKVHFLNAFIGEKFVPLVVERKAEVNHKKPQQAALFATQVMLASMNQYTLAGLGKGLDSAMRKEMVLLTCRYLGFEPKLKKI